VLGDSLGETLGLVLDHARYWLGDVLVAQLELELGAVDGKALECVLGAELGLELGVVLGEAF
jgi:hypothetical protein